MGRFHRLNVASDYKIAERWLESNPQIPNIPQKDIRHGSKENVYNLEFMLLDNHGRPLNYLRLAVTDRCNLRCFYCMPEEGIKYLPKKDLLTFEEIQRIVSLLARMGITKVRLTGGEPFVRTDLMQMIRQLVSIPGIEELHITTNGLLTAPHIPELKSLGIKSVNLSLDTLDASRFKAITRRDEFRKTMDTLHLLLNAGITVKVNAVVMEGKNIEDIIPMIELTRKNPIEVRFIEEMPFNGEGTHYRQLVWTHKKILAHISSMYPAMTKMQTPFGSTADKYQINGFIGTFGIIAAFSRTFCGSCNRIRITAQGLLKTCLYDNGVLNIRDLIRQGVSDDELHDNLMKAFRSREPDGHSAEQKRGHAVNESMSTIGG
jgi:molybdenum cofactor biosynthesis protein A